MKRVLYVRHGESETNARGVFAGGQDDTPLTDKGREQARSAGQELKVKGVKVDRIIASPLSRTMETARIIARELGFDPAHIKTDAGLREYNVGANDVSKEGMTAAKMMALAGREDSRAFADRVRKSLGDINKLKGTTLISGHAGVGRVIECLKTGRDPATFFDLPGYPNGHAVELDLGWL